MDVAATCGHVSWGGGDIQKCAIRVNGFVGVCFAVAWAGLELGESLSGGLGPWSPDILVGNPFFLEPTSPSQLDQ